MPMHIGGDWNGATRESLSMRGDDLFDKIGEALAGRSFISAIALTGGRARWDNLAENDHDVLVVDTRGIRSLEGLVLEGESIDIERAPADWLTKRAPCDLDQAICESMIVADRSAQKWHMAC